MTTDELAIAVKEGREDLMSELWESCVGFIRLRASKWANAWKNSRHDFEYDDFVQTGYFALLDAVEKWEPGRGLAFIGFLDLRLKTVFSEVAGCRTAAQKNEIIYKAARLESPIPGNHSGEEEITLADTIGEQCESLEEIEEADYREYIAKSVRELLAKLPEQQRRAIESRYFQGMNYETIGEKFGVSKSFARWLITKGMQQIRRSSDGVRLHRIYFGSRNHYIATGLGAWKATGSSQPEREAIKMDYLRRRYTLDNRASKIAYCVNEIGLSQEQAEELFPE